jgi:iron complex outermembrane receptor protein
VDRNAHCSPFYPAKLSIMVILIVLGGAWDVRGQELTPKPASAPAANATNAPTAASAGPAGSTATGGDQVPVPSSSSTPVNPGPAATGTSGAVSGEAGNATTGTTGDEATMAPIIVTGSDIPTTETTNGPSPLSIISSDEIAARGDTTLTAVLSHVPEVGSFSNSGIGSGDGFNGGGAYVSLKGLGPQATLVLINGRRTAPFGDTANGQYAFVDLNSIPVSAIDHIEILSDGASAIYGSDAIAGVVNIILKKDLGGADAETSAQVGNTTDRDSFEQVYSQSFGLSSLDHNGNGVVVLDYYSRNSIYDGDRNYSATPNLVPLGGYDLRSSRTFPGTFMGTDPTTPEGMASFGVTQAGGFLTEGDPNENFATNPDTGLPTNVSLYNYNPDSTLVPQTSRYGFYANYGYKFYNGAVTPNIDFSYRHIETDFSQAPSGYLLGDNPNDYPDGIPVPVTNYYNRTGQVIDIQSFRFLQAGDRTVNEDTDDFRVVPSIDVKLGDKWTMNAGFNYSMSSTTDIDGGAVSINALNAALASDNPATAFNPFTDVQNGNSTAVINSLHANEYHTSYTSLLGQDIHFTGPVISLPAGPVELSLGSEHRIDRLNQNYSSEDETGDVLSGAIQEDSAAERSVTSGYAEVHIPIFGKPWNLPAFENLDVYGAGRVDSYSDFGTTINPEARFRWQPIPDLIVRGSFSTGFRAPSLPELYAGLNQSYQFVTDPTQVAPNNEPQVLVNGGGNSALQPERSEDYSIGVILQPKEIPGLVIHSDLFKIRYTDEIAQISIQTLVDQNSPLVIRDTNGMITSITAPYENIGKSLVQGVDSSVSYSIGDPFKHLGELTFSLSGTFLLDYLTQDMPGDPYVENAGQDSLGLGAFPRYRQTASLTWDYETFEFVVSNDFSSQTDDTNAINSLGEPVSHKIDSYSTFDLQASYAFEEKRHDYYSQKTGIDWLSWLDGSKITLGCNNVTDFNPPITLNPDNDPAGTDSTYADYIGRFIYVAFKKTF